MVRRTPKRKVGGSNPPGDASSETALLARVPAFRQGLLAGRAVSSLPHATRCAGLARGPRFARLSKSIFLALVHVGAKSAPLIIPILMGGDFSYRSLAPFFQTTTASLGCGLIMGVSLETVPSKVFPLFVFHPGTAPNRGPSYDSLFGGLSEIVP